MRAFTVPVTGRMIHTPDGAESYQPYGRDEHECNYSVSRAELNRFRQYGIEKGGHRETNLVSEWEQNEYFDFF